MAVGRISGPLLKANLLRDGVDLAFETNLLYLDVNNGRIGIKTSTPTDELQVNGTTRTTNLKVDTQADIGTSGNKFTITGNTISSTNSIISIEPTGTNPVVYQNKLQVGDLIASSNIIESLTDINFNTGGSGNVNIYANVLVNGDVHATGNITADGNIVIGDSDTDSIAFNADIVSDLIPDVTNTYSIGSPSKKWKDIYVDNINTDTVTTGDITVGGVNLILPQGNTIYVATTGADDNSGTHEHDPFRTIRHACEVATAGTTIFIYPGEYEEIFPIAVSSGVTIHGSSLRSVSIRPTTATRNLDCFQLNGETTVEDVTITGFEYDSINNTGNAFVFAPGMIVSSRSPYIRNVTVLTFGSSVRLETNAVNDPRGYDAADAGHGAFLDGSIVGAASKEAAMLFHSVTFITPAANSLTATNGVRVEWLNSFTYFAGKGLYAYSSPDGFAQAGKTRLRINTRTGTWAVGNTLNYYDIDGTTVLGTGVIDSIEDNFVNLTGRCLRFVAITDLDPSITTQDLRTSAGGTASSINFADYSDFGAEIRSIGSANVYGDYGAYGDGAGVIAYLVSQNFAYVGSGKLLTNDPTDRIGANEVVELNSARIYRTSVDNEGNFQVGNNFYINQKTGDVLFDSENLLVTSATGVTFTDGVNTTTITPTDLTTGNIRIHDNNIDSLTGDVIVTAASGAINLQNNTFVTGNLDVTGDVNIGGNITIGDASTDTISFVAGINSNLVPATTATYDLGTTSLRWNNTYLSRLEVDGLVIDNNTVSTTVGNDDLILTANGTGKISIPSNDVLIDQNLTVTQDLTVTTGTTFLKDTTIVGTMDYTGSIIQTGDTTINGNYEVTGHITSTGYLQLPQVRIENNVVSTTTTNTDLELQANGTGNVVIEGIKISNNNIQSVVTNSNIMLTPQGTGSVVINSNQSLQIPVGTTAQRPGTLVGTTATTGMIRYNTDLAQYEGYDGTYWIKLSGVQDLDGNTYIKAESTLGANDNTLYFYANNNLMVTIDATKMFAERLQTSNLDLNGNTITSITANSNLNLTATGTGGVRVGNLRIYNNTITNVSNNAVTEFTETGTGYVKIAGTNGFVIPSGDGFLERPLTPEVGMTRFNTDAQLVEVYNGVTWGSVAGASGGVTSIEANELGIAAALILG